MSTPKTINVQEFINSHKLSSTQILLLVLCFLIVAIDGFDLASIGFIAPAIKAEWGATPAQLAPLFGSGLIGLMLGALIIGPLADRFGRKAILIFSVVFFRGSEPALRLQSQHDRADRPSVHDRGRPRWRDAQRRHPDLGILP
jgi:Major Facilitator Superfamily